MTIEVKTGTRSRVLPAYGSGYTEQHTVEVWINGIRFTTDASSAEAARSLAYHIAQSLGTCVS